ncbi:hypothetical protein CEP53_012469 [Fusarium sp. AF-6]|nr:hypothetical protein CEP53_012469 [Fusarium sp. AF-6]
MDKASDRHRLCQGSKICRSYIVFLSLRHTSLIYLKSRSSGSTETDEEDACHEGKKATLLQSRPPFIFWGELGVAKEVYARRAKELRISTSGHGMRACG